MSRLPALLRRLPPGDGRPDADLLAAFQADHDEAAFAELVRRHGPLVWAVCRRHLPDPADAEDAFQAAFLVLVRRAGRLGATPGVGPWLYRVAAWTARNVRRKNARMLARRRPLPAELGTLTGAARQDFDLDDALLALPEKYRTPLVLCHLQGWTRRAAAEHLGCPEGTLSSLLSHGLAKLRTRLAGRDPAAVLAVAAAGAVPADLAAATVRTAAAFRLAVAPPALVHLTEGVLRMFWVKKAAAASVAAAMLLTAGVGVGLGVKQVPAAVAADDKPAADKPKPADPAVEQLKIHLDTAKGRFDAARLDAHVTEQRRLEAEANVRKAQAQLEVAQAQLEVAQAALAQAERAKPAEPRPPRRRRPTRPTRRRTWSGRTSGRLRSWWNESS